MNKPNKSITIARAIIRIGDAARDANDYSLLGALHEMVEQLSQHGVKDADVDMDCCWNMSRQRTVAIIAERAMVSRALRN